MARTMVIIVSMPVCSRLILRLRGNFYVACHVGLEFYADDPENNKTAHEMGVIMGTSHHEPMARNHQEWARKAQTNMGHGTMLPTSK